MKKSRVTMVSTLKTLVFLVLLMAIVGTAAHGRQTDTDQVWTFPAVSMARGGTRGRRPKPKGNSDGEADAPEKQPHEGSLFNPEQTTGAPVEAAPRVTTTSEPWGSVPLWYCLREVHDGVRNWEERLPGDDPFVFFTILELTRRFMAVIPKDRLARHPHAILDALMLVDLIVEAIVPLRTPVLACPYAPAVGGGLFDHDVLITPIQEVLRDTVRITRERLGLLDMACWYRWSPSWLGNGEPFTQESQERKAIQRLRDRSATASYLDQALLLGEIAVDYSFDGDIAAAFQAAVAETTDPTLERLSELTGRGVGAVREAILLNVAEACLPANVRLVEYGVDMDAGKRELSAK